MSGLLDRLVGKNGEEKELQDVRYIKAIPLRAYEDIDIIKAEVRAGNIVICNVAPLAKTNIEDVKRGINELNEYANLIEGDIEGAMVYLLSSKEEKPLVELDKEEFEKELFEEAEENPKKTNLLGWVDKND